MRISFLRRQSPDWALLAEDYRHGRPIDPQRYVPDHAIVGFPDDLERLIGAWNRRFAIDFFTYRRVLARLSDDSVRAGGGTEAFAYESVRDGSFFSRATGRYVYFHDDDDFFDPRLGRAVRPGFGADAIVTPLIRVGVPTFLFSRGPVAPHRYGEARPHDFRYQTNNYGIARSRLRSAAEVLALKDHVAASAYADAHDYVDRFVPEIVSATVKTPGSASMLRAMGDDDGAVAAMFDAYTGSFQALLRRGVPGWLAAPLDAIAYLTECIRRGEGYGALDRLRPRRGRWWRMGLGG